MSEEQLDDLPFSELVFRANMLDAQKAEQFKNQMVASAFLAWQLDAKGKSFSEYLKVMGLAEKELGMSKENKDLLIKKATATANRILELDRRTQLP